MRAYYQAAGLDHTLGKVARLPCAGEAAAPSDSRETAVTVPQRATSTVNGACGEPAQHTLHLVKVGRLPGGQVFMGQKLDKVELRELFARVSKQLKAQTVEVDVAALQLGDQIEADWVRLLGLSYDPRA